MAFWGPPFSPAGDQARLACAAGIEQFAALHSFRAELPDLTGFRRGIPHIDMRIGVATGEVIVGNIGSDVSMSYTVIGDAVNFTSKLEKHNKDEKTRALTDVQTYSLAESQGYVPPAPRERRPHRQVAGVPNWVDIVVLAP